MTTRSQGSADETTPADGRDNATGDTQAYVHDAIRYLDERGIAPADAKKAGIYPVANAAAVHPGFKHAPALVIPYIDPWAGSPITFASNGAVCPFRRVRYLEAGGVKGFVRDAKPQRFAQVKGSAAATAPQR